MNVVDLMQKAKDSVDVHEVFGEPYRVGDVTIIPVVRAGGGGGAGAPAGRGGEGYGFGIQPAGVYAIKGDSVKWVPATNVNTIVNGAFIVGALAVMRLPRMLKQVRKLAR